MHMQYLIEIFGIRKAMIGPSASYTFNDSYFEKNALDMFRNLYDQSHFVDVTIACEDGKLLQAHQVVLATASDYMKNILIRFSNPHPLLYIGDISSSLVQNILEYAYSGEVAIDKTCLESFMEAANKLKIKGLLRDQAPLKVYEDKNELKVFMNEENPEIKSFSCESCNYKTTTKENLRIHSKSIHEGIKYPCDQCDYKATQRSSLNTHKQSIHEGITYACEKCDYKAKTKTKLKIHMRGVHEGQRHPCNLCSFSATAINKVKLHQLTIHDGLRFPCNLCDYKSIEPHKVKMHISKEHDGLRFACENCDHQAKDKKQLKRHNDVVHLGLRFYCEENDCNYNTTARHKLNAHNRKIHTNVKLEIKDE